MVRFLLEAGADQEHKTDEMHTALMEASMDGHVEVARLLLDSGAQVSLSFYPTLDRCRGVHFRTVWTFAQCATLRSVQVCAVCTFAQCTPLRSFLFHTLCTFAQKPCIACHEKFKN